MEYGEKVTLEELKRLYAQNFISPDEYIELVISYCNDNLDTIENRFKNKYNNWKLLKNKKYETIGYKRAYLDFKKLRKKLLIKS